jgi:hypothetical protein
MHYYKDCEVFRVRSKAAPLQTLGSRRSYERAMGWTGVIRPSPTGITAHTPGGPLKTPSRGSRSHPMKPSLFPKSVVLHFGFALITLTLTVAGQRARAEAGTNSAAERDGQHDFDFNVGVWHTHIHRILDPLAGGTDSVDLDGNVTVRKVWGGKAQLEEIEADGPKGHWEGLTLFLYNPKSHQWSQSFINSKVGELHTPSIGTLADGRVELMSQGDVGDRTILVRGVWSDIKPDSHHYEEAYSDDNAKTWHIAFSANLTREKQSPDADELPADLDTAHLNDRRTDFDFDFGTWKTHSSRLLHPLTGSTAWADLDGVTVVRKVWGGRANLAEYKAEGSAGAVELLALRWYNPAARQWNLDFATPQVGVLGTPGIGEFKNGRVDFYGQDPINGRTVLVRFSIWGVTPDTAQSEQAFSDDGGKTWEVNWRTQYTRMKDAAG